MTSGYRHCACRDCFQIAIGDDDDDDAMCLDCEEAGCDGEGECDAPGAYDCAECDEEPLGGAPMFDTYEQQATSIQDLIDAEGKRLARGGS